MKIGIDIDDTIADTTNYLIPKAIEYDKKILKRNGLFNHNEDFPKCFGWNNEELKQFLDDVFDKEVMNLPIKTNVCDILKKLKNEGNEIIIISSRNSFQMTDPYETTLKWLNMNNIAFDKLIVDAKYKGPIIDKEKINIFIDDSVGQCTFIVDNYTIKVIMIAKASNNIKYPNIVRLQNWDEIYNYINNNQI